MAKIVGFTKVGKRADGYKTRAGFTHSEVFIKACTEAGKVLNIDGTAFLTKRQAGKFASKEGIVYKTLYGESTKK